jgi:ubiquitin-conjugating enzyme E2 J1
METDAQGQLGGLDTPDAVRRRFAKESGSFVCPTCGKSNLAIIQESEERFKDSSISSEDQEVAVPKELKMGWRDEMEKRRPAQATPSRNEARDLEENGVAQLAEGFVQTAPPPVEAHVMNAPGATSSLAAQGATESIRGSVPAAQQPLRPLPIDTTQPRPLEDDGVPLWLDRAIVGLVLALVAVLLKVLFGA